MGNVTQDIVGKLWNLCQHLKRRRVHGITSTSLNSPICLFEDGEGDGDRESAAEGLSVG